MGNSASLDNLDVTALRYGVSGLLLLPFLLWKGIKNIGGIPIFLMVLGAGAPYMMVVSLGLTYSNASHFGVITPSTMMIFSTVASILFLRDKLDKARYIGLFFILIGVIIIGWKSLNSNESSSYLGGICFLVGGVLWGTYTIAAKKWGLDPLHSTAIVSVFSMAIYLPFYISERGIDLVVTVSAEILTQAIYQGALSAFLALFLYTKAVSLLGGTTGSIFAALVPVIAMLLAIPMLEEIPTTIEVIGAVAVTMGMIIFLDLNFKSLGLKSKVHHLIR